MCKSKAVKPIRARGCLSVNGEFRPSGGKAHTCAGLFAGRLHISRKSHTCAGLFSVDSVCGVIRIAVLVRNDPASHSTVLIPAGIVLMTVVVPRSTT